VRRVILSAYQATWRDDYEREAALLQMTFAVKMTGIHHIGSTSIPGMPAKPIIDILVAVKDIQRIDLFNASLEQQGYIPKGEYGIPGRRFFIKGSEINHSHHVHIFQEKSGEIPRHLRFRDYLISHADEARQYAQLKTNLANQFPLNIEAYQNGKKQFIGTIDDLAIIWRQKQ
jgi:GrpB-like predicted nucleotidyltransferase (UPF0157 family)